MKLKKIKCLTETYLPSELIGGKMKKNGIKGRKKQHSSEEKEVKEIKPKIF